MSVVRTGFREPAATTPVELEVVDEERLGVVERGEHARHLVGDQSDLLGRGPLSRQARRPDLEDAPRLEHLVAREAVERRQKAERPVPQLRRPVGDVGARALPGLDDAHRLEGPEPGPERGPADLDLQGEVPLGREPVPGMEAPVLDEAADVLHDFCAHGPFDLRSFSCGLTFCHITL